MRQPQRREGRRAQPQMPPAAQTRQIAQVAHSQQGAVGIGGNNERELRQALGSLACVIITRRSVAQRHKVAFCLCDQQRVERSVHVSVGPAVGRRREEKRDAARQALVRRVRREGLREAAKHGRKTRHRRVSTPGQHLLAQRGQAAQRRHRLAHGRKQLAQAPNLP
jgi:hypothetical protein